jgi:hypothetical protein
MAAVVSATVHSSTGELASVPAARKWAVATAYNP